MVTRWFFTGFVGILAAQRLFELRVSQRNEKQIIAQGGEEHDSSHFTWMKLLHFSWFIAMLSEVFILRRPFNPLLSSIALALFAAGQSLRFAAIRSLGPLWTVRIVTLPNQPMVKNGIYRYFRHPNYLGVVLEILAVPLLHSAYLTAMIYSFLNGWILSIRIPAEVKALEHSKIT